MTRGPIYLGFTCCPGAPKVLKSRLCRGKWKPEKVVDCPNCESPVELASLEWFEKMKIIYYREMCFGELS